VRSSLIFQNLSAIAQKNSTFAAADQILLSASNFLLAYYLITKSGAVGFGIYSFIMVFTMLLHGFWASVLHGQMTLRIAGSWRRVKDSYFSQTVYLYVALFCCACLVFLFILAMPPLRVRVVGYEYTIASAVLYIFLFSLYDLCKRFLYTLHMQRQSFTYTLLYFIILSVGLLSASYFVSSETGVISAFIVNSAALFIVLCANKTARRSMMAGKAQSTKVRLKILSAYMDQGRFGALGTFVTWLQNQSITPILMFFAGPAVVGYFNIARLIMMPAMVVNTGIVASALPQLRSLYKRQQIQSLRAAVKKFSLLNLGLSSLYIVFLILLHWLGFLQRFIPEYSEAAKFLTIWAIVVLVLTYRTWFAQHFIVAMQFKYLLFTGVIATLITLFTMIVGYTINGEHYIVPLGVLFGDVYLIFTFYRQLKRQTVSIV